MYQLIQKDNFTAIEPIICNSNGLNNDFLNESLCNFFSEMDLYMNENEDYEFWTSQQERTFLSMFLSGIVRNDIKRESTILQEYGVWDDENKKSKGRCDAYINNKRNAILIEAKRDFDNLKINDSHWDIDEWLRWDEDVIGPQLFNYYSHQKKYITKPTFKSCQLITLVFKLVSIDPIKHLNEAHEYLGQKKHSKFSRGWFYTFLFHEKIKLRNNTAGLEVYGTIKTVYK